jgi:S-methylmethionine-dependent homocysteine/selenocysteine methylase
MVQEYQTIAGTLQPYVDVLLAETLSTTHEALAAAEATISMGEPPQLPRAIAGAAPAS